MLSLQAGRLNRGLFFIAISFALLFPWHAQAQSDGAQALPAPGKALVFVFRKDRVPLPAQVAAYVNSKKLGQLSNNSYVSTAVEPGAIKILIGDGSPSRLDLVAAPNQRYFVRVDAVFGVTVVRTEVQTTSEQEGLRAIGQSRFAGDGTQTPTPLIVAAPAVVAIPSAPKTTSSAPPQTAAVAAPQKPVPTTARSSSAAPQAAATTSRVPQRSSPESGPAISQRRASEPTPQAPAPSSTEADSNRRFSVSVSTGRFAVSSTNQTLAGLSSTYDASSKSVFSLQAEWRDATGLAFGGEVFTYSNDITTSGSSPDAKQDAMAFMANTKYYFRQGMDLQPFVGAGLGFASATYSGTLAGSANGLAYQALLGAELRLSRATLHVQYKYLSATIGSPDSISVGGSGILFGAGVLF